MAVSHRDVPGILAKHGYAEIRKIGEGSFGKAILVQSKDGSRMVCKMVDISKASRKETDDAMKEGQLLATLKHPYIVRYRENYTVGSASSWTTAMEVTSPSRWSMQREHAPPLLRTRSFVGLHRLSWL